MRKFFFTAKSVEALQATGIQLDYWDEQLPNFGIRVSAKGKKVWILVYRYFGRQRRLTLGRYPDLPLADARQIAQAAKGDLAKGNDPAAAKDAARRAGTFGELAADYLKSHSKRKKRSWKEDERIIDKEFLPAWRFKKVNSFTRREIRELVDAVAQRGAGIMANRCLSLLKTIFTFGVNNDWLAEHPCFRLPPPTRENRRDRILDDGEIEAVWTSLGHQDAIFADILKVQLLTAQRIGEVLSMRWADVDLETGWGTIPRERSKNDRPHQVPLSAPALAVLKPRRDASRSDYVFPAPRDASRSLQMPTLHKALIRICKDSEVSFRTHDLRRTAATRMAAARVSETVVAKILNHKDVGVTARHYNWHNYDPEKRRALATWGRLVEEIVSGAKRRKVVTM